MMATNNFNNTNGSKSGKFRFKFIKQIWIVGGVLLLIPVIIFTLISFELMGELPNTRKLENPKLPLATQIFSADGVMIGKYYLSNREPINYYGLCPSLKDALIATEDTRFFNHTGIDFSRTLTIIPYNLIGKRQGASTITQQLAKNLFPRHKSGTLSLYVRKLQEWVMAVKLERLYTKEELISMYLNTVPFGNNAVGIKSAAYTYFKKLPANLSPNESAFLIGLLQAPSRYNPKNHPEAAKKRRNIVLSQMEKYGYITETEKVKYQKSDLNVGEIQMLDHVTGIATYFREYLRQFLNDWAKDNNVDLYTDGLKIYTTIDSRMQKYAEEAVAEHMRIKQAAFYKQFSSSKTKPWSEAPDILDRTKKRSELYKELYKEYKDAGKEEADIQKEINVVFNRPHKMNVYQYNSSKGKDTIMSLMDSIKYYKYFLQPGFISVEPTTGNIKTWVGGLDLKYFQYDHCDPKATRQVGSTFKPFVYTAAIQNGISPCQTYPNTTVVFENYDNWAPKNSDNVGEGQMMTLFRAIAGSVNKITARLIKEIGVKPVIEIAKQFGITAKLDPYPSLCLGVADISLFEMVGAYNTFNNGGTYIKPQFITEIRDKNNTIKQRFTVEQHTVLDSGTNYVMLNLLQGVLNCRLYGTACRMRYKYHVMNPMAGKTGTTQNQADGWFMGLIPQLTGGIWVGCEDPAVHFTSINEGQGAEMAMPVWSYFVKKLYADKSLSFDPTRDWIKPNNMSIEINCQKYDDLDKPMDVNPDVQTDL